MSTTSNPFTQSRQNKFTQLYDAELSTILPTSCRDIINWLLMYIKEEHFNHLNAIRQDLGDMQYSVIRDEMQQEFKWDDITTATVANILLNDVFTDTNHFPTASSTMILTEDEEAKVFYPTMHHPQPSTDYLAEAYQQKIGGSDAKLFSDDTDDLHSNSHIHEHELTPMAGSLPSTNELNATNIPPIDIRPQLNGFLSLGRQRTTRSAYDEEVIEDACNEDVFPEHLNVALFHRSDDESLELLIDRAVLEICYGDRFADLWTDRWFIQTIYSDKLFPKAVDKVFERIEQSSNTGDGVPCTHESKLGFIGSFVNKQFKRQINEYKRKIEEDSSMDTYTVDEFALNDLPEEDEKHCEHYLVYYHQKTYVIHTKKQSIGRELFTLEPTENTQYSWAVWKKYTKLKKDHVRSKGYWEVREKDVDATQSDKIWKALREAQPSPALHLRRSRTLVTSFKSKVHGYAPLVPAAATPIARAVTTNKGKKKSKFMYIPLIHLRLIFQLMQIFYQWSIQSDIAQKQFEKTHPNVIDTPFYIRYCEKSKSVARCKECDKIKIDDIEYTLLWWNNVGQTKCNAFCIQIGKEEKEYYYLRFKNNHPKFRWDWYDNNKSRYTRYVKGYQMCVYKELEASFQGNIDENFPRNVFVRGRQLYSNKPNKQKHMFDVCVLRKLAETLQLIAREEGVSNSCPTPTSRRDYLLRFTFHDTSNHIINMEQLSIYKNQNTAFSRNVRRIINNRDTIHFYFQSTDEYIEEWKKRYTLSTLQQQKYFFSFILCICAVIKYIECEFTHQIISFPFNNDDRDGEQGLFTNLDDSDVQRHKRNFELWSGFFIPPEHQFQTTQMDNDSVNRTTFYKELAIVEPFCKFRYRTNKKQKLLLGSTHHVCCNHIANVEDILWLSNRTQDVYCNRCGVLLQFTECIRKYVLETENNEVVDFLWPWYRNHFYRRDVKKYHTSIAKYNLTYLFRVEDALIDMNKDEYDSLLMQMQLEQNPTIPIKNNSCCNAPDKQAYKVNMTDEDDEDKKKNSTGRTQIRHLRKHAAHVLLGGWDILRNLNIIRNQLQCIFEHENQQDQAQNTWKEYQKRISECNTTLRDDMNESKAHKLMELHDEDLFMNSNEQNIFSNLIEAILKHAKIYDPDNDTVMGGFNNRIGDDPMGDDDDDDDLSSFASSIGQEHENNTYYTAFKQSWKRVPMWWFYEHDILLLELALKFNWDRQQYKAELTHPAKKQYYQELLTKKDHPVGMNDDHEDEFKAYSVFDGGRFTYHDYDEYSDDEAEEYVGYREFQVWCENWRNIQHRLRYITFVVCDYFYACSPSMVEIRIPDKAHRIEQYECTSIVFLNGYMKHVHLANCGEDQKDLNSIREAHAQLNSIAAELTGNKRKTLVALNARRSLMNQKSKSADWNAVLADREAQRVIQGNSSTALFGARASSTRIRDPFMKRDLDFELEQICQSFDLLEYGTEIATFLIKLLKRKQLDALWKALGIVLEHVPYEYARHILERDQADLRHGKPSQLKTVCDHIVRGSNFSVHIKLFLAEYMENNGKTDLARYQQWMRYSKKYEQSAGQTINTIESNHLLAVLLDIPLTYSGDSKVSLLQVALEQNRAEFLNNERINAVMAHIWQSPSGLAPDTEIKQANDSYFDIFWMLFDQPYHFYLTPMGFNATIKTLHLMYLCAIFVFIWQRQYLDGEITTYEWLLWSLNIGYILYECIEAYDKGVRSYLSLAGWINYWDLCICAIWIVLFVIRMSFVQSMILFQIYMMLWAIQTASISARSLVLFQTSSYFGVLLRMLLRLMAEMLKFLFVLALLILGFVFGLYYIEGGYVVLHASEDSAIYDWYEGFKYLFELTVGAGDFSELNDIVDEVPAQLFVIFYLIIASILMMNLLIALLTTTYETIHVSAKTASSFAFAESTYDLAHRSRFLPAPLCIYIFIAALVIHCVNFVTAMISPHYFNIYNCIHHHQYEGFDSWKMTQNGCFNCKKISRCGDCGCCKCAPQQSTLRRTAQNGSHDLISASINFIKHEDDKEKRYNERCFLCCRCCIKSNDVENDAAEETNNKIYRLNTRGRVWKYYASSFNWCNCCCCDLKVHRFAIYHNGCYSCIPTALGAKVAAKDRSLVNGITLNQYAEIYEKYFKFNLDPADIVLLKHLTVNSLFCKYCYRPFDPKSVNHELLTPFWALSEIASIYAFPWILWLPLCLIYGALTLIELVTNCLNEERQIQDVDVDDYDRQYFAREALNIRRKQNKTRGGGGASHKKKKKKSEHVNSSSSDDDDDTDSD
eukprot:110414_1